MKRLLPILVAGVSMIVSAQSGSPSHPFFQLNAASKRMLVANAARIQIGDSYQTVVSRMGSPTFDTRLMRKESNIVVGRSLKYYAVKWESGLVNEIHDELVDVLLDASDRVKSVTVRVNLAQ